MVIAGYCYARQPDHRGRVTWAGGGDQPEGAVALGMGHSPPGPIVFLFFADGATLAIGPAVFGGFDNLLTSLKELPNVRLKIHNQP